MRTHHIHQAACSEDVDVLVHAAALVLRDALGDPHDVADLLLLDLHVRVVHAVVELLLEGEAVEVDLELKELVLDRLLLIHAHVAKEAPVLLQMAGSGVRDEDRDEDSFI